jgi:hypothetical protein
MSKPDPKDNDPRPSGRFAYEGLQRSIHEKARLGIMTSLLTHPEGVSFNDLKQMCALTDGNLSRHLEVLQHDCLIVQEKVAGPVRQTTVCYMTDLGRKRFLDYLEELQRVIADAAEGAKSPAIEPRLGWAANG